MTTTNTRKRPKADRYSLDSATAQKGPGWAGAVLAPLLVVAGWNFVLSAPAQLAAYTVLLLALLVWAAALSAVSWRRDGQLRDKGRPE